jgi:16S rRNA (uracil1498-N3)-methyltransferase
MQLFYNSELNETTRLFSFSKDESRHIVKVLRKSTGDRLTITNGVGWIFEADVIVPNHNKCVVEILKSNLIFIQKITTVHLAVSPTKLNDRYEWFLEKATEIGVTKITPVISHNSERKKIKSERFKKIIQSATKQSLNPYLPSLNPAVTFSKFLKTPQKGKTYIAHCAAGEKYSFKDHIEAGKSVTILIGPEGGFSGEEISTALKNNYIPVSLGSSRLRTETAAIVACHTIQLCNE